MQVILLWYFTVQSTLYFFLAQVSVGPFDIVKSIDNLTEGLADMLSTERRGFTLSTRNIGNKNISSTFKNRPERFQRWSEMIVKLEKNQEKNGFHSRTFYWQNKKKINVSCDVEIAQVFSHACLCYLFWVFKLQYFVLLCLCVCMCFFFLWREGCGYTSN